MKKAVMYGAGNIGRGFIGQLFSESGYEVLFIDINENIVKKLQTDRTYPLYITHGTEYERHDIKNVTGILGKSPDVVADTIASADVMATAVGVNILPHTAKPIAYGIKKRFKADNQTPLNIIICENMLEADKYLKELICEHLTEQEIDYLNAHIGFVEASIGRMVPATPDKLKAENILSVCVEEYCELPVDKSAFKGDIPYIKNLLPYHPFDFFIQRKLFVHNMSHALTAYLGHIYGYEYVWQASLSPSIKFFTFQAIIESALALSSEHNVPMNDLVNYGQELLYRYENKLLGDTNYRVGRDTVRKLSKNDRLIGSHNLCLKHRISPVYICLGIAAALCFEYTDNKEIPESVKKIGLKATLNKYCELYNERSIALIEKLYFMLTSNTDIKALTTFLEQQKRCYFN